MKHKGAVMKYQKLKEMVLFQVEEIIKKKLGQFPKDLKLVFPPNVKFGDFAIECFSLAKQFHKSPDNIAKEISDSIKQSEVIQRAEPMGPYVNIKISNKILFGGVCTEIILQGSKFGETSIGEKQRVMVEYLSPNTNKPLHLGHIRNGSLGMTIANLLEATGHRVIKTSLINDRGVHICKSILAWQQWGKKSTPKSTKMKGDHFVGSWYVRYAQESKKNPGLKNEILEMLKKWEARDSKVVKLWKMMNSWVYEGFNETYKKLGLKFDTIYYESNTYKLGKNIIAKGLKKGIFHKDKKGNTVFDLPQSEFGLDKDGEFKKVTLLRPDGTSLYITQDIGTALLRVSKYNLDRLIYVVGSEQGYHFKSLFKILEVLGYKWSKNCHHLSYGMVYLPDGKMKSREGKIVDADDLIRQMEEVATKEICKRHAGKRISKLEVDRRASIISVGAIKFYLLRVETSQDIHFNPQESISFDGFTGPYCQYAYARISGILKNAENKKVNPQNCDFSSLGNEEELLLIQKLIRFPEKIKIATSEFNPSHIATHVFDIAKAFNQFYNKHQVLHAQTQELVKARLVLIKSTAIVLKKGLNLLGIDVLEEM